MEGSSEINHEVNISAEFESSVIETIETNSDQHEHLVRIAQKHFEKKGYRVHSGLQFGCELVLYADDPDRVHSDFCVHVLGPESRLNWRTMQTLVRSMPDLHKTLIVAQVRKKNPLKTDNNTIDEYDVDEIAFNSEHAPFRHKKKLVKPVGSQTKKVKVRQ